jgi:hypothetical protein
MTIAVGANRAREHGLNIASGRAYAEAIVWLRMNHIRGDSAFVSDHHQAAH